MKCSKLLRARSGSLMCWMMLLELPAGDGQQIERHSRTGNTSKVGIGPLSVLDTQRLQPGLRFLRVLEKFNYAVNIHAII